MGDMKSDRWQRLRPLLDRALELDGEARHQYLDGLPGEEQDLRPDLERLLAEQGCLGRQTLPNAMELAAPAVAQHLQEDAELDQARVGQDIGAYRLVRLLGTGGMGAVYLAERSQEGFTHAVALKVVRKALGSQMARERFERERQILAGLKHPGIALLFDGGETGEGQSFYTMEYVDGEAITEYCNHHADTVAARVRLLLQIATTLSYAHQNLIVHRDIKPSNVLVTREGSVKLVDFGLAKLLDEHSMPTMTQTGLGPMTPVYAAPEQFLGKPTTVATDVYQFGVLCFLILTGRLPYRADPNDSLRWARAVTEEEPTTLARVVEIPGKSAGGSIRAAALRLRRQLTRDLDAIVRRALAKSPQDRYRSMDAMIADLEAFLAGRPVTARPAGPLYFTWRFIQRRRYAVGAAALATIVLGAAGAIALRQSYSAAEQAERAAREAEIRNVTRAMLTDLLRAGPASAGAQRPTSALEALDQGTERTLRTLGANPQHRAIAVGVLAESYLELDHPQRARTLIEQTLPMLEHLDNLRVDALQLDLLLARAAVELGDVDTSKRVSARAETIIQTLGLPHDAPSRLAASLVRVQLAIHEGKPMGITKPFCVCCATAIIPGSTTHLEFADLLRINAVQSYDSSFAIKLFERAWKIVVAHYGEDSPAALAAQRLMIQRDLTGPRHLDTDRLLDKQEADVREAFGEKSLDYADVLEIRCESSEAKEDYSSAAACWRQTLSIREQAPDDESLTYTIDNVAAALLKLGRPAEALPFYERELALRSGTFAPTDQNLIHSRLQIAKTRCLMGDIDVASREFDAAIVDYVASMGPLHPYEAVYAAYFARCLLDAGHIESARSVLEAHARLDPPRKNMTEQDRADVAAVWQRLPH